jgi:hypothetical protein
MLEDAKLIKIDGIEHIIFPENDGYKSIDVSDVPEELFGLMSEEFSKDINLENLGINSENGKEEAESEVLEQIFENIRKLEKNGLRFGQIVDNIRATLAVSEKDIFSVRNSEILQILEKYVHMIGLHAD